MSLEGIVALHACKLKVSKRQMSIKIIKNKWKNLSVIHYTASINQCHVKSWKLRPYKEGEAAP